MFQKKVLTASHLNRHLIIGQITALFSNSVLSQGMTALVILLTARQLNATVYGQYAACYALTGILSVGFNLGLDIMLLHEGGRDPTRLRELVGSVLAIKVVGGAIWCAAVGLLTHVLDQDIFPSSLLWLSAFSMWMDGLFSTMLTAFKTSLHNKFTLLLESTSDFVWLASTVILLALNNQQAEVYIQAKVAVLVLSVAIALVLVNRVVGLKINFATARNLLRSAFPFAISDLLSSAMMRLDVIIVAFTIGKFFVGLYSPAVSIANAFFLVPSAIYLVMLPVLSNLFATNTQQAWQSAKRTVTLLLVIGTGMSVSLLFGARYLIWLLGESYYGSIMILQILSALLLFKSGSFALAAILIASGKQTQRMVVQAIAVAFNAVMNLMIVYRLGITGVAIVYVLTEIITLTGYSWLVRQTRTREQKYK